MPKSRVVIYREEDGSAPFVDWFRELPAPARDKVLVRIEPLRELGHELRTPEADLLREFMNFAQRRAAPIRRRAKFEADPAKHTLQVPEEK
jgi:hypothetical protein